MIDKIYKTRLYSILSGMKQRCYNHRSPQYEWYGAKGVTVCEEWTGDNGVQNFIEWALNNGYEEHLTIDRINPDGNYEPRNCRWITRSENASRAHKLTPDKLTKDTTPGIKFDKLFFLLASRGLSSTNYLRQEGMHPSVVNKLRKNERVNTDTIGNLCRILQCQPGDILEYVEE